MPDDLEKVYCRFCNLAIGKQKHKRLPRGEVVGEVLSFSYWHQRQKGDCWDKAVTKAKTKQEPTIRFHGLGVIS